MTGIQAHIVEVVVDLPAFGTFDYLAPAALALGTRVIVPFGRGRRSAIVVGRKTATTLTPDRLKSVEQIPGDILPRELLDLLTFAARYYAYPEGAAFFTALPAAYKTARVLPLIEEIALTEAGRAALNAGMPKAARQQTLLEIVARTPYPLQRRELAREEGFDSAVLVRLLKRGWLRCTAPGRRPLQIVGQPVLTLDQQKALQIATRDWAAFSPTLLQGVTGSGKTEVYLRMIAGALSRGGQALLLVPEIGLTPQLEATVAQRFPTSRLVVLHSKRSEGERLRGWQLASVGAADIVIGTRLAVFTPMPNLGVIVVDEEHDSSFKQQEGFRYSARDLALVRAQRRQIPLLLGSATPSLETFHNVRRGKLVLAAMTTRAVSGAAMPMIEVVDVRRATLTDGLSARVTDALAETLTRGEQSLVFINRRGYAPVLYCRGCGAIPACAQCSSRLVVHLRQRQLRCHYCGFRAPVPMRCSTCGSADLEALGEGTQRIEDALAQRLPHASIARFDRDSTQRKHAARDLLDRVHKDQVDILVGTQMLAKGHDFPRVALVVAPDVDGALFSADFRAAERLYALLTQVAGRAGRHGGEGRVLIQTRMPDHPLFAALKHADYSAFSESLLAERAAAGFPPYVYQALLRAEARTETDALQFLLRARLLVSPRDRIDMFDPVPATVARIAGKARFHLLTQSRSRSALQRMLSDWVSALSSVKAPGVKWALDVDPLEF